MRSPSYFYALVPALLMLSACAQIHHVQIGSIDNTANGIPIEVVVKTVGVDAAKVVRTAENISQFGKKKKKNNKASNIVAMFQMGPKTGAPIYDEVWGEKLMTELHLKCPTAKLKNIHSIRTATDYAGSGITQETVIIRALCIRN